MTRRLLNILATASLLLCVAASSMWLRSYWRQDAPGVITSRGATWLMSSRGKLGVLVLHVRTYQDVWSMTRLDQAADRGSPTELGNLGTLGPDEKKGAAGFGVAHSSLRAGRVTVGAIRFNGDPAGSTVDLRWAFAPYWSIILPAAIAPAARAARRFRRRRAIRPGLCPMCGYDLRATPDRCPECGTNAAPA
jgi:hypothetical protein